MRGVYSKEFRFVGSALLFSGAILVGCGKQTTTDANSIENPPVGVVNDAAGFYVRYTTSPNYTYYMHRAYANSQSDMLTSDNSYANSYGLTCVYNPTDTSGTSSNFPDTLCYLEASELDLFFNGVSLQYNVPSTMCTYFEVITPWYFKYPVGQGPGLVANSSYNGAITDQANSINGKAFCPYDFSKWLESWNVAPTSPGAVMTPYQVVGDVGPNCCIGDYAKVVTTTTTSTSGTPPVTTTSTSTTVTDSSWGASVSACLGGPGTQAKVKTALGIPKSVITYVSGTGLNAAFTLNAPIKDSLQGNVSIANYFTSSNYNNISSFPAAYNPTNNTVAPAPYPTGSVSAAGSAYSPFVGGFNSWDVFQPIVGIAAPSPFYEYRCLDNAREIKARIRVLVRSWDTAGLAGSSAGPYGYANVGLGGGISAPTDFQPSPFAFKPLHDFSVWDNFFPSPATNTAGPLATSPTPYQLFTDGYPLNME